jgi:hypothetical protein
LKQREERRSISITGREWSDPSGSRFLDEVEKTWGCAAIQNQEILCFTVEAQKMYT